jgi:predicted AlkP superfamily phosphohydrolase/phosphomutase
LEIIINDVPKTTGIDKKEGSLIVSLKKTKELINEIENLLKKIKISQTEKIIFEIIKQQVK